jgi:hypothetical protein
VPAYFHNGSFTRLDAAIRFHLDTIASTGSYRALRAEVAADLYDRDRVDRVAQPRPPSKPPLAMDGTSRYAPRKRVLDGNCTRLIRAPR